MTPALEAAVAFAKTVPPDAVLPVTAAVLLELAAERIAPTPSEGLLTIEQAARRLTVSRAWLYRHAKSLPFTRKLSHRELRFDPAGLEGWLAAKAAGGATPKARARQAVTNG